MRSRRTISASWVSTGCRLSDANAVTRISAPSSSRMLRSMRSRDELQHVAGHGQPVLRGLLAQDGDARLQLGRLDVGDQAPLEPGAHAVFQGLQPLRRPVGGHDDLLVGVVQGVEGVEELLLRAFLALQELDVVDEQHVDVAVAALEGDLAVVAQGVDEVVGELLGGHVAHAHPREQPLRVVADGVQQVGLAQAGVAPDEQRVVRPRGRLGDGDGRGVAEPVRRADDERVEDVLLVQAGLGARRGGLRRRARPRRRATARPGAAAGRRSAAARGRPSGTGRCRRAGRAPAAATPRGRRRGDDGLGAGRVGHLGAAGGRRRVDDHGEVDRDAEVAAQRVADRAAQDPLDGVLGELAGRGEERGAVDEPERSGEAEERALLRRQGRCARARGRSGEVADDPVPDLSEISCLVGHRVGTPLRLSPCEAHVAVGS